VKQAALIIIDVQEGLDHPTFYGVERSNPNAESNMAEILAAWRERGWPVIHVKHKSLNPESPLFPGKKGNEIKKVVRPIPNESVIAKQHNSAFAGTDLSTRLASMKIDRVVIIGLTLEHCVSSTVRAASDLGFRVTLVGDATAAFSKENEEGQFYPAMDVHQVCLAALNREFASVVATEELLASLR